ncbi:MAG: cytochrome c biogenesis protein ResB [Spirochaetaceae bacterium]|nr:cytochrome c biogenesis protein ResB [Spirochaetaceae bacterium]
MRKLLSFFTSMRLAIVLIAYLALAGTLATFVPQGEEPAFYASRYPRLLAALVVDSGFSGFFRSWLFILPAFLFFANLSACTIRRLSREIGKKERRRHGPDLLHFGLMILVVGSILSFSGREEGFVRLAEGDAVELPGGGLLRLERFEHERYADGRPLEWTSEVSVSGDAARKVEAYPIRVNHPLRLGRYAVYQVSHDVEPVLAVLGPGGAAGSLARGEELEAGGFSLLFLGAEDGGTGALVLLKDAAGPGKSFRVAAGEAVGPFRIATLAVRDLSGLKAVADPGYLVVLVGLLIAAAGMFFTFIRKIKDFRP